MGVLEVGIGSVGVCARERWEQDVGRSGDKRAYGRRMRRME